MSDTGRIIDTFTTLAPRYEEVVDSELNRFWGWSYAGFIKKLFEMTLVSEKDHILDLATGTGAIPQHLRKEKLTPNRIHALDITMPMLARAKHIFKEHDLKEIDLVCASAMEMPYANAAFTLVICGLATHHMDVMKLIYEMQRVLTEGGRISIADVGGSLLWRRPGVKLILQVAAYIYFLFKEDNDRAWAEAGAISNIRSMKEWANILYDCGFTDVVITKLKSKHFWIPEPLVITASKSKRGET